MSIKLIVHKNVQAGLGSRKEVLQPSLRAMAGDNNLDKLILLIRWALRLKETEFLPKFTGGFNEETGAFWFQFDKETYFQRGGREVISDLLGVFNSQGWPMVSCWGSDYWAGAFPRKPKVVRRPRCAMSSQIVKVEEDEE